MRPNFTLKRILTGMALIIFALCAACHKTPTKTTGPFAMHTNPEFDNGYLAIMDKSGNTVRVALGDPQPNSDQRITPLSLSKLNFKEATSVALHHRNPDTHEWWVGAFLVPKLDYTPTRINIFRDNPPDRKPMLAILGSRPQDNDLVDATVYAEDTYEGPIVMPGEEGLRELFHAVMGVNRHNYDVEPAEISFGFNNKAFQGAHITITTADGKVTRPLTLPGPNDTRASMLNPGRIMGAKLQLAYPNGARVEEFTISCGGIKANDLYLFIASSSCLNVSQGTPVLRDMGGGETYWPKGVKVGTAPDGWGGCDPPQTDIERWAKQNKVPVFRGELPSADKLRQMVK